MRTFLRLLAFGSSLLVRFFFRTMKMMILMMMSILLTENTTAKEKKKKRRKRSSYFLTNTHTHTSLSLSLCVCVCVCRFLSENPLPLRDCCTRTILYITSDEKRKIFSREKERNERTAHVLGLKTLNKKTAKNLSGRKCIDATRRDRLV